MSERLTHGEFEEHVRCVLITCEQVLAEPDTEGVFGQASDRESVVLNVLMGDENDEDRLAHARRLNPTEVWDRYRRDLEREAAADEAAPRKPARWQFWAR